MEKEEPFHFPFGFETATRPWASFSRKKHTRIHPPFSLPFISLYFFLLSFSFSLIFAHFSIPISAHDPKEDWKESRANVSRVPPSINSPSFGSRRGSRACASNTLFLYSLWPWVCLNTRRSNIRFYPSWIVPSRAIRHSSIVR